MPLSHPPKRARRVAVRRRRARLSVFKPAGGELRLRATIDMRAASLSVNQALFTDGLIVEIPNLSTTYGCGTRVFLLRLRPVERLLQLASGFPQQ